MRLVVSRGLQLALLGIGIGTALALSGFLFGIDAFDPATFGGIALVLLAATAIASYVPARRAAGIDPMTALRAE